MRTLTLLTIFLGTCQLLVGLARGAKLRLLEIPVIATFYPEQHFKGVPFPIQAIYGTCYNFHGTVASVHLNGTTEMCEVYLTPECDGDGAAPGDRVHREISWATDKLLFSFIQGKQGHVQSLKCWGEGQAEMAREQGRLAMLEAVRARQYKWKWP